jgi:hypothetical protein
MGSIVLLISLLHYFLASLTGGGVQLFLNPLEVEGGNTVAMLSSLVPVKPKPLTKAEREQYFLTPELKGILVGLFLGDLYARRAKPTVNTRLLFLQSIIHKEYLLHLYDLFKDYCKAAPIIVTPKAHKETGKVYPNMRFEARSLPCFNYYFDIFYPLGKKCVPANIGELMTPFGLAYWIAVYGCWNKVNRHVVLCTDSFTLPEVELLINVLNSKWNFKCYKVRKGSSYRIIIPSYSIPVLQELLSPHMPPMMKHKIGL